MEEILNHKKLREALEISKFLEQEALIETRPSTEGITKISEINGLYFGIGLSNGVPILSAGLPFDILSMILCSEQFDAPKNILIADSHALSNGFDAKLVDRLAGNHKDILEQILENLDLNNWTVTRASEIDNTKEYNEILNNIHGENEYVRRELADMCWYFSNQNINLKVGWALKGSKNSDEIAFDKKFEEQFNEALGFIYTCPAKTLNPQRVRSAPYFCVKPNERIILSHHENPQEKLDLAREEFGKNAIRPYEKYITQILRLYDKTIEKTQKGKITQRTYEVLERCFK